ncbi:MAG: YciI family protein [Bdellovibrionota bacterium]
MQFLVIGHDGKDPEALNRRLAARQAHIELGNELRDKGNHLVAAAILDDQGKMVGSTLIVDFESREELDQWLAKEPYVTGKVWEKIEVTRCQVGPSFQGLFQKK